MSELLKIKKVEFRESFITEFEEFNKNLTSRGAEPIQLASYIQVLRDACPKEALDSYIEEKAPLKSKILSALEDDDPAFNEEIKRLLEKREKRLKSKPKETSS